MTTQPKGWTREESAETLNAFLDSEEGRRFREIFLRDCTAAEDRAVFLRDAERRAQGGDEAASRWWNSLLTLVNKHQDQALALAEPLAQHGLLVEEIYENLPESFDPLALTQAIARASGSLAGLSTGISITDGWTEEAIRARLEEVRARLDWQNVTGEAREWWEAFEQADAQTPALQLRLAEELAVRNATLNEFHAAYLQSGTENIQANLHYLDYSRLKQSEAARPATAVSALTSDDSGWWLKPAPNVTKVRGWTDERIRKRLEEVRAKLGWEDTADDARAWWEAFEAEHRHRLALVLRLAEELANRNTTVAGFHAAAALSSVSDIRANLHYLDYTRRKEQWREQQEKEEERKNREAARENARQQRLAAARNLLREWLPFLEADQPFPEFTDESKAILLNVPRDEVPIHLRERFDRAIGAFEYETVLLDETGAIEKRRAGEARRFVEELIPGVPLEMVEVPGGTFLMGSDEYKSEQPIRKVTVPPFHLGKFTITQEQWSIVAGWEKVERDLDTDPARFKGDDRPVECVSWDDAKEFCARLSRKTGREYRLPTEAEWEYACRAGTATPFAFGETIAPEIVNYDGEYPYAKAKKGQNRGETIPVGSLSMANAFGLFDMHGNVWEWCEDVHHGNYEGAPTDGSAWLSGGDSSFRRLRGGSWGYPSDYCRSAYRDLIPPDNRNDHIGLRVVVARVP